MAASNKSAKRAFGASRTLALHVPEYTFLRSVTSARQAPFHPLEDLLADQVPLITVLPAPSSNVQLPAAVPAEGSAAPVHVPEKVRPVLVLALQVES